MAQCNKALWWKKVRNKDCSWCSADDHKTNECPYWTRKGKSKKDDQVRD